MHQRSAADHQASGTAAEKAEADLTALLSNADVEIEIPVA